MSESLGRAVLELVADLNPLKAGLAEGRVESEKMATQTASGFRTGITKAAVPAAAALGVLAIGLHKAVDAAQENQAAEAKLAAAFKQTRENIDAYKGRIDATEASSAALGFKSEDVKASLAQLVVATGSGTQAIQMLGVAQNVARYKNISLSDASKLLTTTLAGSARAAHALGIVIPPVTTATDALKSKTKYASLAAYEHAKATAYMSDKQATAHKMVELLTQKLGGQAQAFSKTAQGAKEKMGAEFQLLEINIGNVLLPVLTSLSQTLAGVSEYLTQHAIIAKIVIAVVGVLAASILAVKIGMTLYTTATKMAAAAQWLFNAAMDANPIGIVVIALAALGAALYLAWTKSATFRAIVMGVWKQVKGSVLTVLHFFTRDIPAAFQSVLSWVKGHWPLIATLLSGPFAPIVAVATNAFGVRSALLGAFGDMKNAAATVWNGVAAIWGKAWSGAWALVKGVINLMIGGINALISAWDSLHFHFGGIMGIGAFTVQVPQIPTIPLLASGGIVTKPTLAMVGEAGPEAVVPLSHALLKHGGTGSQIVVHVSGVVGNERDVALKIGRELQKLKGRGVDFGLA